MLSFAKNRVSERWIRLNYQENTTNTQYKFPSLPSTYYGATAATAANCYSYSNIVENVNVNPTILTDIYRFTKRIVVLCCSECCNKFVLVFYIELIWHIKSIRVEFLGSWPIREFQMMWIFFDALNEHISTATASATAVATINELTVNRTRIK